jgi:hypothetical protein
MRYSKRSVKEAQQNGELIAEQVNERMDGAMKLEQAGYGQSVSQMI